MKPNHLCWIRRDLRFDDHHALYMSLQGASQVFVVFIFDTTILNQLKNKSDQRVDFIYQSLVEIEKKFQEFGSSLIIRYGDPKEEIPKICSEFKISTLFFNRDYEPYAKKRDDFIKKTLEKKDIGVHDFKDHVFYEKHEVLTGSRDIYKVFTPYKNKWLETFSAQDEIVPFYKCNLKNLAKWNNSKSILNFNWYKEMGFSQTQEKVILIPGIIAAQEQLKKFKKVMSSYDKARDFPALNQTSNLSPYIRMGNISIREMISASLEKRNNGSQIWLSELIWRDFYQVILDVYPKVETHCFKQEYDKLNWPGTSKLFDLWCEGKTGYPIIDAAMRCLNATGMMHNRLRMIVASFLTKTLLVDWRNGEKYFAALLLDYDLAANNGGWQWSASTGVDAQPYFRIFNPYNQSQKFDPEGEFIRHWCPELKKFSNKLIHAPHDADLADQIQAECQIGKDYPHPIVNYKIQKEKALKMFKEI